MQCPSILGNGVTTQRLYCDVLGSTQSIGRAAGHLLPATRRAPEAVPSRCTTGGASESEVKAGRAFAPATPPRCVHLGTGEAMIQE